MDSLISPTGIQALRIISLQAEARKRGLDLPTELVLPMSYQMGHVFHLLRPEQTPGALRKLLRMDYALPATCPSIWRQHLDMNKIEDRIDAAIKRVRQTPHGAVALIGRDLDGVVYVRSSSVPLCQPVHGAGTRFVRLEGEPITVGLKLDGSGTYRLAYENGDLVEPADLDRMVRLYGDGAMPVDEPLAAQWGHTLKAASNGLAPEAIGAIRDHIAALSTILARAPLESKRAVVLDRSNFVDVASMNLDGVSIDRIVRQHIHSFCFEPLEEPDNVVAWALSADLHIGYEEWEMLDNPQHPALVEAQAALTRMVHAGSHDFGAELAGNACFLTIQDDDVVAAADGWLERHRPILSANVEGSLVGLYAIDNCYLLARRTDGAVKIVTWSADLGARPELLN